MLKHASKGFVRAVPEPRDEQPTSALIKKPALRQGNFNVSAAAFVEKALAHRTQKLKHYLRLVQLAHSLTHAGMAAAADPAE